MIDSVLVRFTSIINKQFIYNTQTSNLTKQCQKLITYDLNRGRKSTQTPKLHLSVLSLVSLELLKLHIDEALT